MPETALSWQVIQALAERLQIIRTANGFRTDIGARVVTETGQRLGDDELAVSVLCTGIPVQSARGSILSSQMEVVLQVELRAGRADAQFLAHAALADLAQALPTKQRPIGLPEYCTNFEIADRRIFSRPEGADLVIVQVTARADLSEKTTPATV